MRSSSIVKTKAYKNAFYHIYVCPTSAHRDFRYGYIYVIFSAKKFVLSMIVCIFAASVLAKPLNNAQIVRGVFCLYAFEYGESYSLYKTL